MGDPCFMWIRCLASDQHHFEKLGFVQDSIFGKLVHQNAPYALVDELEDLARKGVLFKGTNGNGESYGEQCFASDGKQVIYMDTVDGDPVIRCGSDPLPTPWIKLHYNDIVMYNMYVMAVARIDAALKEVG